MVHVMLWMEESEGGWGWGWGTLRLSVGGIGAQDDMEFSGSSLDGKVELSSWLIFWKISQNAYKSRFCSSSSSVFYLMLYIRNISQVDISSNPDDPSNLFTFLFLWLLKKNQLWWQLLKNFRFFSHFFKSCHHGWFFFWSPKTALFFLSVTWYRFSWCCLFRLAPVF